MPWHRGLDTPAQLVKQAFGLPHDADLRGVFAAFQVLDAEDQTHEALAWLIVHACPDRRLGKVASVRRALGKRVLEAQGRGIWSLSSTSSVVTSREVTYVDEVFHALRMYRIYTTET